MKEEPNFVFIIIDALRAKNFGCYGYPEQTSPNIDRIANEGVTFENAYSCAPSTHPSLTSIFSGRYTLSHGIIRQCLSVSATPLSNNNPQYLTESGTIFLPEILKSEKYVTLAVDWLGRWLKRGYDYYSGIPGSKKLALPLMIWNLTVNQIHTDLTAKIQNFLQKFKVISNKIMADGITDKAIDLIKRFHKKKFFLFLHYWDTHCPYDAPKSYVKQFINNDYENNQSIEEIKNRVKPSQSWYIQKRVLTGTKNIKEVLARYDASIAYVDHEVGRLIEALENRGILNDTFIIVTADHGESLTEHGIYFSHHGLYDTTTHVPLVFKYSGFPRNKRVKGLVQHTDIVPTILNVLGLERKNIILEGKSVLPLIFNETDQLRSAVYAEEADTEHKRAIRTTRFKYIYAISKKDAVCRECDHIHGGELEELYDLSKDPEEVNNVIMKDADKANLLRKELNAWVKMIRSKNHRGEMKQRQPTRYSLEEEIIAQRLKELGYL